MSTRSGDGPLKNGERKSPARVSKSKQNQRSPDMYQAADMEELLRALRAMRAGDFTVRLPSNRIGIARKIADAFNGIASSYHRMAEQLERVGEVVSKQSKTDRHVRLGDDGGSWADMQAAVNTLIDDLLRPTAEGTRVIAAEAELFRKSHQLEALNRELEQRVAERTSELEAANERLLQSERGRSIALAAGNMGSWHYDHASAEWYWDEGQDRIFGLRAAPGTQKPHTEDLKGFFLESEWMRLSVAAAGATPANNTIQTEITILRTDGERRYCLIAAAATFGTDGKIVRIDGVTFDITDRKEAERRQALLAREVDHRARNALAVVQSVIRLTRDQPSSHAFREAVEGRVRALAKAHELLSQARWQGGDVQRLAREELAPYLSGAARLRLDGPPIVLSPDRAQTVALVLHELATNAAKYGALSEPSGTVDLSWVLERGILNLRWVEKVGHMIEPPTRNGVGTRIILASTQAIRGGQAAFDWQSGGLVFTLSMPMVSTSARQKDHAPTQNVVPFQTAVAKRVLLVEDEALTGMFMHDLLEELGYDVFGPIGSVEEAMEAATKDNICAALLDVNLRGETIDPVAAALVARHVPIALVTGYSGEHIDAAFSGVPVLRKPVAPDAVRVLLQRMTTAEEPARAANN
jgi:two-component sensor histidine kinase